MSTPSSNDGSRTVTDARAGRRLVLAAAASAALAVVLVGCGTSGFHLRGAQEIVYKRIALSGFADRSTMADAIKHALPETTTITPNLRDAEIIVEALVDTRETTVEASTAFAQVRELRLHCLLRYRVLRPDGTELLKPSDFERFRDLTYNESDALAKDTELNVLYRDMQSDIAVQLMRILAAIGKPTGPAARIDAARAASAAFAASQASQAAPGASSAPSAPTY
jgi:LPS-assembly lipoprotein